MKQIIECVPNFSEGNNMEIIKQICHEIESVDNIKLLNIDPGKATNRTVVTFVGPPSQVCEAAFKAIKKAAQLIDMSKHKGEHPRFGACDVCPLVPIAGITMDEVVEYSKHLAQRVGDELGIPVYCYENSAREEKRRNLANCRSGEYEGLPKKLINPDWKPDYGPSEFNSNVEKSGAVAIGARNFLIAYNINLNTTSTRRANAIAFDIREKGRVKREGNKLTGKKITNKKGEIIFEPGLLKCVKGIGWYIEEYGIAQLSFNLTDINISSMHQVFETACKRAEARGLRVTGSELVGLVPLKAMLDAGKYFLNKQQRSTGISDNEIIKIAIKSLGLDELTPFDPQKRIIEYIIDENSSNKLISLSLQQFSEKTASESVTPGGGSVSAYLATLGVALGTMVANLSAHKRGWDDKWKDFSDWADKGKAYHNQLLQLVDEDTQAYNAIMIAFGLQKNTDNEIAVRKKAIDDATKKAIEIPFKTMQLSFRSMEVMEAMAKIGNPNSSSDAGVGAIAACAAVRGAFLNVKINTKNFHNQEYVNTVLTKGAQIVADTLKKEKEILKIINL